MEHAAPVLLGLCNAGTVSGLCGAGTVRTLQIGHCWDCSAGTVRALQCGHCWGSVVGTIRTLQCGHCWGSAMWVLLGLCNAGTVRTGSLHSRSSEMLCLIFLGSCYVFYLHYLIYLLEYLNDIHISWNTEAHR